MFRFVSLTTLTAISFVGGTLTRPVAAAEVDFAHDIVPILRKRCAECHLGEKKQGGFSMNTRELLLAGGESGRAVVAGHGDQSPLMERIATDDVDLRMPPEGEPLTAKEVSRVKQWIDEGAAWDAGFSFGPVAYEPPLLPRRPALPSGNEKLNPVDRIVDAYLREHDIAPLELAGDAAFLRRVHLDVTGLLPDRDALAEFLADERPDKRTRVVRELLANDIAYAEHWLTFWNDLLRNDYTGTGFITQGRKQITTWLYDSLLRNKPYDQFIRELIAPPPEAEGFIQGIRWRGNVNASQTQEIQFAQNISQAFLGINMKCASCHDSFIDRWTLKETYGLAAIYATEPLMLHRCDKPLDEVAQAAWIFPELGQVDSSAPRSERLRQLAALMTHPENGRFTRTIVNRLWQRTMGRGIVHPVDAMHTAPWNADLLDFLAIHLADHGYDLKTTIELICTSRVYQSLTPSRETPEAKPYVFRGPRARRMTAEQFMDAVWQLTGAAPLRHDAQVIRAKLDADPAGDTTAIQAQWIWSRPNASDAAPGGETISLHREFELTEMPSRAVAVITCDNSYQLFVNDQQVLADDDWETVEPISIQASLQPGTNRILIVATNAGEGPNPAGVIFEARCWDADGVVAQTITTDSTWQWTGKQPDRRGKFKEEPDDWQPAVAVANPAVWARRVDSQLLSILNSVASAPLMMVRASLVKSDALMRSLGRPNRDQIVTSRPDELTTLEAIGLANGQTLADAVQQGAGRWLQEFDTTTELVTALYAGALSREPSVAELSLAEALLGREATEEAVQDLLWSIFMLPEFQLVR